MNSPFFYFRHTLIHNHSLDLTKPKVIQPPLQCISLWDVRWTKKTPPIWSCLTLSISSFVLKFTTIIWLVFLRIIALFITPAIKHSQKKLWLRLLEGKVSLLDKLVRTHVCVSITCNVGHKQTVLKWSQAWPQRSRRHVGKRRINCSRCRGVPAKVTVTMFQIYRCYQVLFFAYSFAALSNSYEWNLGVASHSIAQK